MKPGSGAWVRPLQILNRPQTVPTTGEKRPAEFHELASFPVEEEVRDQRTLLVAAGEVIEIRLPWALLGFADPSSLKLFVEHPDEPASTEDALPIRVAAVAGDGPALVTAPYTWEPWQQVAWHERRKAGFDDLAQAMREVSAPQSGD